MADFKLNDEFVIATKEVFAETYSCGRCDEYLFNTYSYEGKRLKINYTSLEPTQFSVKSAVNH